MKVTVLGYADDDGLLTVLGTGTEDGVIIERSGTFVTFSVDHGIVPDFVSQIQMVPAPEMTDEQS